MKTLHTIYNNFAKRNLASLRLLFITLLTLTVIINAQAETIASWGCMSISANTDYKAIDGDANNKNVAQFSSSKAMTTSGTNAYYGSSAGGAVITFSNLDLSNYTDVMIYFYSRASQAGSFSLSYSTDGTSFHSGNSSGILEKKNTPSQYSIALPSNSEDITTLKLSPSASSGSLYFGTVTITGTKKAAASYTITPQSNNTSYGTVSLSGTTITAIPNAGYRVKSGDAGYSIAAGSATVINNGDNTFSVTPSTDCTITINFEVIPTFTVNWYVNGSKEHSQTDVAGMLLTNIPNLEDYECGDKVFVGWTTQSPYEHANDAPNDLIGEAYGMTIPESDVNYYAVFATKEGNGNKVSILGGTWTSVLDGWTYHDDAMYSGNGKKFDSTSDYVQTVDFSQYGYKAVSVDIKAGYNQGSGSGTSGSKLKISALGENLTELDSQEIIPEDLYTAQNTVYTVNLNATSVIAYVKVQMTYRTSNLGMKYCEVFASTTTYSNFTTDCTTETAVSLDPNGGTGTMGDVTTENGTLTLPKCTFTREGYTFAGWATSANGEVAFADEEVVSNWDADITELFAKWTAKTITITWDANGGSVNPTSSTYTYNGAMITLPIPTRTGYSFNGWFTAATGGTKITEVGTTNKPTENVTYYAQWTEKALTRYRTDCDACIPLMGFASISGTYHFFPDETITLTVTPPADAVTYTYQWQKLVGSVWTDIDGATTTIYTKDAATIADAGRYRCVVSSEGYCDAIAEYNVKCLQLYVYYDNKSDVFNAPLKKVDGATATIDVELQNAGYTYYFKITDGCGNWYGRDGDIHSGWCTDVEMNADAYCGLKTTKFGTYVFNVNYSDLTKLFVSVLYPSAYQAADKVIYLDNDVLKWTNSNNAEGKNKIYYRIGRSDHNSKHAMTLVPGTANLYKVTTGEYNNFDVWHLANNGCWSDDGNSIFKTNTGDGWAATQATAFETLPVTSDVVTVTPTDLRSVGGDENNNNCEFYNYDITEGMKTWNAKIEEPTHGTITVKYTHHDGTAVNDFTSGTRDLAHTCLLTITATPNVGYSLASLTVNDVPFTSGNVHTLTEDAVIKATFTINTHTVTWKPAGGNWDGDASDIVQEYEYGAVIEAPDKPTYDCHEFVEWNSAYTVGMTMPDEDLVFTAKWNKLSYTITFKNYDGTVLQTSTVECGETPSYTGATPTREQDAMFEYEFAGWDPTVAEATGDQIYTATYNQTKRQYTVTWFVDGKQIDSKSVAAGDLATAPEVNPIPCGAVLAGWTDAENGVYKHATSTLYEGAQPSIEITDNKTFYAVFADLEGAIPEIPTVIAYWENQKLLKDQGVSATIGAGTMTSNIALSAEYPRTHSNSNISSTYPTLTLSNLNLSSHTNVSLLFWARASQQGTITIKSNLSNDAIATITTTKEEKFYVINNIPSSATSITLTYGTNSGSFYFGSVKLYSAATYSFEKLTAENTNGWSGNDWNGYYLITNDQNSLRALDGNGINEDCHFSVTDNNGIIEYSIASAFQVEFLADKGYCVKGVGDELYLGVGNNSVSHSANPIYHESIGYNSLYNSSSPTSVLSWNNSGSKFGFYGSIQTSAPQMYKIMSELSNYRTLCVYDIEYTNTFDVAHTNPLTYTAANLPLEFAAPTSTREGYTFKGWNPATLSAETRGDQTVTAQWAANTYSVIFNANGGTGSMENQQFTYDVEQALSANQFTRVGYTFAGWNDNASGNSTSYADQQVVKNLTATKDGQKTLYAQWTANTNTPYVVKHYKEQLDGTYLAEADDTDNLTGTTASSVTPEVKSYEGFTAPSTQTVSIAADGSTVVTYQYTRNSYNLSWNVNEGDALTGEYTSGNVKYEAAITQPNTPTRTGYTFTGWSPAEIPATMPANNLEFIAQWAVIHTVTWMVNGSQAEGDPTTSVVNGQTITTLPTAPDVDCNGKVFVGWTTPEIVGETATIPDPLYTELGAFPAVTSNMTFYAVFANGSGEERWVETEINDIEATDEVVVAMQTNDNIYAMYINDDATATPDARVVEQSDLTSASGIAMGLIWFIEKDGNEKLIIHPKKDIEKNLYCNPSADNDRVRVGKSHGNHELYKTFEIDGNYLKNSVTQHYIGVNFTHNLWYGYANNSYFPNQTLKFYKKTTVYTSYTNYSTSCVAGEFDITNTDPIYVTSAVGQKIKATDKLVLTTTDMAVGTEISLSAPKITFYKEGIEITQLTTAAASETFELEIAYQPTTANITEQPTITLEILGQKFTFDNKIFVRSLPETFAIVAKVGDVWYALPSQGLNSTTPPVAYPVEVDDIADPTAVVSVPANADWSLRQVYANSGSNDRFADNGENLVFVNNASPAMALNASTSGNYLLTDAQYDGYHNTTNPGLYEWTPTTTDLETYQLTNEQRSRTLSVNTATVFGVHATDKVVEQVRFLPIQNRYTPAALQVVEWKENSVVVMYNGNPEQTASVSVNGGTAEETILSSAQRDIAVYELAATSLAANPAQRLSITIGTEKVILSIPYIISGSKNDIDVLPGSTVAARQEVAKVSDLVILKGATLTAAGAKGNPYKFRNVTIYGGGKLVIPSEMGFGVNSLTLRAGGVTAEGNYDYVYPQFVLNGTWSNTSGKINLDYLTTKEQYYTFVTPFAVNTKGIKYPVDIYGSNVAADNTGSYEFQYYDGAARAAGNTGWMVVNEDPNDDGEYEGATLNPGQGYTFLGMPKKVSVNGGSSTRQQFGIHRIPMTVTAADAMTHENSNQSAPLSVHLADKNNDSGWNLIGNPYMATIGGLTNEDIQVGKLVHTNDANGNWTGGWHWDEQTVREGQRFLVIPSNDGQSFESVQASNATLPAFKNFFVQISNENANALVIPYNKPTNVLAAPARRTEEVDQDIELAIVLEQDEAHSDQLDFLINNAYTAEFDYKADFTKMMNTTNLNLYGVHTDDNLSFLALDNYSAQQSVAIGYQVPAAGEYMLRMSDKAYVMFEHIEALYVTDHEMSPEHTVDIMEEPYTFHVAKAETNNTRFTVSLKLRDSGGGVVTGFENVSTDSEQPLKFFYQDKLYIMRNGLVYDATGKQVHVINE